MNNIHLFSAFHSRFHVTSGQMTSLPGHFRSPDVTCLPPPASYSLVESEMYNIRQFSAFHRCCQVTSGQITSLPSHFRSPEVTSHHFLSRDCLIPASYCLVGSEIYSIREFSAFYSHFQVTSNQMTSLAGHFRPPEITSRHFLSRDCFIPASYSLVGSEMYSIRELSAFYSPFQVTSGQMTALANHFRSPEIT